MLHGLWPQYERGWPRDCRSADRGYVPAPVADRMLDIMPSKRLVFHEYRKHGTCSGLGVDGYFDLARQLYDKVKIPRRFVGPIDERMTIAPGELVREFIAANPQLKPDMIAVSCGGPGNRLREVRICFDKGGAFRACGRNEDQAQAVLRRPHVRAAGAPGRRRRHARSQATDAGRRDSAGAPRAAAVDGSGVRPSPERPICSCSRSARGLTLVSPGILLWISLCTALRVRPRPCRGWAETSRI